MAVNPPDTCSWRCSEPSDAGGNRSRALASRLASAPARPRLRGSGAHTSDCPDRLRPDKRGPYLGFEAVTSQLMVNETRGCRERSDRLPRSLTSTWPVVEAGVAPRCCEGVAVALCSVGTWAHLPLPHDSWEGACLMQSPGGGTATQADTHSPCSSVCMSISFSVLAKSPSPPLRNGPGTPREGLVPLGDLCP